MIESSSSNSILTASRNPKAGISERRTLKRLKSRSHTESLGALISAAQALQLGDLAVHGTDELVNISTNNLSDEPDLRYVVYLPFLHLPGFESALEQAAKAFTSAITSRSKAGTPISFDFNKPTLSSVSSTLAAHASCMSTKPADYVGALHNVTYVGQSLESMWQPEIIPLMRSLKSSWRLSGTRLS
jgi:hypothetical protein